MLKTTLNALTLSTDYVSAAEETVAVPRGAVYEASKRVVDCVLSGLGLLALLPVFLLTALAVRLDSRGPALFCQDRVGRDGKLFRCWKFRSMYLDAEKRKAELMKQNEMSGGVLFKMKEDPRITRVGKFIRKASIDELPQLWNVFIGDMSLVGPRPAVPAEVDQYTPYQRGRLQVKPGITCLWQVSGRSDLNFEEQVRLDLQYARIRSLGVDFTLLFKTIPAVLFARGAY
jgi:exopolysaccharide biosynthesis polyprenyl glycosylphosphotransferase